MLKIYGTVFVGLLFIQKIGIIFFNFQTGFNFFRKFFRKKNLSLTNIISRLIKIFVHSAHIRHHEQRIEVIGGVGEDFMNDADVHLPLSHPVHSKRKNWVK